MTAENHSDFARSTRRRSRSPHPRGLVILFGAAVATCGPVAKELAAQQEIEISKLDGTRASGSFVSLRQQSLQYRSAGGEATLPLDEVISIQFETAVSAPSPELAEITFPSGWRLRAHLRGGEGESLALRVGSHGDLALPYGQYSRVEFLARTSGRGPIPPASEGMDRIYVTVGEALDVQDGIVVGFDQEGVQLEDAEGRERSVRWPSVAAILFGSTDEGWAAPEQSATLRLGDGSQVRGALLDSGTAAISIALSPEHKLDFAPSELTSIELHGSRFVRLTELTPAQIKRTPFFQDGPAPFHVHDQGIYGQPLRVAGKAYARGIALRPICDLQYDLGGSYRQFQARVGIDDASEPERHRDQPWYGTVRFRVEVDGQVVWTSPIVRAGQAALDLPPIDLSNAKSMTLCTEFADGLPAGDLPIWLEPLLVR